GELFYDSRYDAFSRFRLYAGVRKKARGGSVVALYYCRQEDDRVQDLNVVALVLTLRLRRWDGSR
ncbi:MAG TPA: hypothetical protein VLI67_04865, partial [Vicinamibacteria bacterium]|nr:hypothetical protein [Vicinamibacteria bacterium]